VDLGPEGPRFDLNFRPPPQDPLGLIVALNTSVVPRASLSAKASATSAWPITELIYDPRRKAAALLLDGIPQQVGPYFGHLQFREDCGLFFGSTNDLDSTRRGDADFGLVMFVIQ